MSATSALAQADPPRSSAPELAIDYLETSAVNPGNSPAEWAMMLPALDPIRCTPRFKALVQKLKTSDPRAATVCVAGTK